MKPCEDEAPAKMITARITDRDHKTRTRITDRGNKIQFSLKILSHQFEGHTEWKLDDKINYCSLKLTSFAAETLTLLIMEMNLAPNSQMVVVRNQT